MADERCEHCGRPPWRPTGGWDGAVPDYETCCHLPGGNWCKTAAAGYQAGLATAESGHHGPIDGPIDGPIPRGSDEQDLRTRVAELEGMQFRVWQWVTSTFGLPTADDVRERSLRFVEEALELAQSLGMSDSTAHGLVDYVWGRPAGEPTQEVGGVMVTLLALAEQYGIDVFTAALTEIARIETPDVIEKCQRKQAQKEIEGVTAEHEGVAKFEAVRERQDKERDLLRKLLAEAAEAMAEDSHARRWAVLIARMQMALKESV